MVILRRVLVDPLKDHSKSGLVLPEHHQVAQKLEIRNIVVYGNLDTPITIPFKLLKPGSNSTGDNGRLCGASDFISNGQDYLP